MAKVDSASLEPLVQIHAGDVYNATAVDATVNTITRELARQGYAFSDVRPHGQRDEAAHQIAVAFTVDDGPKVYIERIDVVGNTRTRDYVIRREFDIGEGDPYNHAMVEQGERRLNRLGYFQEGACFDAAGIEARIASSSPSRSRISRPVRSASAAVIRSTAGFLAEVAFTETNFLGRGQYVKLSASEGQYSRGWGASFTEPYFLDQRLAAGFDVYHKEQNPNTWATYYNWTTGANAETRRAGHQRIHRPADLFPPPPTHIRGGVGLRAAWQSAPASAQVTPQNVVIEGSTHTDAATIRSYFTGIDQASVNRAVADLSATGMFSKVSAKIVGGQVLVSVVESSQIINRVAFEGNNTLKSDQLSVEVQEKGHTGFDAAKADADVQRIKDAYKKIGRAEVQVSYRLVQLPNGRVDVVFKVNEGDKTGVREIKFVGNQASRTIACIR